MGWDVFISHASEDKQGVAVPLKAALERLNISVWLDIDQITLGDSFRSKIDGGLQQCRFGVVILSPRFFSKPWAKAELDAIVNMDMSVSGEKRLLPVIYGMSFDDLKRYSPLLAGRKTIEWKTGIDKVVEAIATVVLSGTSSSQAKVSPQAPVAHQSAAPQSLALFLMRDGRMAFADTTEIEAGNDATQLTIKCVEPETTSLVQEFGRTRSDLVAIAFDTTAILGRITEAVLKRSGADTFGHLKVRNEATQGGNAMEMSFNGVSADQLAEMRARRILLNEQSSPRKKGSISDPLNWSMLDHFISGQDGFIKVKESPLPRLYKSLAVEPETFVSVARLAAVMYLCLSGTVETVLKLDLLLKGPLLTVRFSGRRARRFANVDPVSFSVDGTLDLAK